MSQFVMPSYETFARFYDAVNGEPEDRIVQILKYVETYRPHAKSVLELGCGTGAILAGLGSGFELTGIDLSSEMLEYAKRRCPSANFLEGDMTSFSLSQRFDVVVCVFDTLNHVTTFEQWRSVFDLVLEHLVEGGLFIFDVNTLGRMRQLGEMAPWVHDFDGHTLIMNVEFDEEPLSIWDIRIFEHRGGQDFLLHHERISELGVALDEIREALSPHFTLLDETDSFENLPTDDSARAVFIYQKKAVETGSGIALSD